MIFTGENVAFEQTDEDEYALSYWNVEDDGDNPVEIRMTTAEAVGLFEAVEKVMRAYVADRDNAYQEWRVNRSAGEAEDSALDPDDPKHPAWAERMAEATDAARKREKEGR